MRTKTFFIILLIVALGGMGAWYVLYGKIVGEATIISQALAKQQESQSMQQQDQSLASFLSTASSTAATLLSRIVPANDSVSFISMIEALAKRVPVGLQVQNVSISSAATISAEAPTANFDTLTLSLSAQGSWNQVYTFISMLETLPYKVRLNNIVLSQSVFSGPGSSAGQKPQSFWTGTLSLSVLKNIAPGDLSQ